MPSRQSKPEENKLVAYKVRIRFNSPDISAAQTYQKKKKKCRNV